MNVLEAEIIDLTGEEGFKEKSQKYFEDLDITIQDFNLAGSLEFVRIVEVLSYHYLTCFLAGIRI